MSLLILQVGNGPPQCPVLSAEPAPPPSRQGQELTLLGEHSGGLACQFRWVPMGGACRVSTRHTHLAPQQPSPGPVAGGVLPHLCQQLSPPQPACPPPRALRGPVKVSTVLWWMVGLLCHRCLQEAELNEPPPPQPQPYQVPSAPVHSQPCPPGQGGREQGPH